MAPFSPQNDSVTCTSTWGSLFSLEMDDAVGKENKNESGAELSEKASLSQQLTQIHLHLQHTQYSARIHRDVMCMQISIIRESDGDSSGTCAVLLASKLVNVGYAVSVRTALGSGGERSSPNSSPIGKDNLHRPPVDCFKSLRHEFLLVHGQREYEGLEFVVDLAFRDQFEIPQPTPGYQELLNAVPQVFVGPFSRLVPIVHIVCSEMASSFSIMGQTLPPWRKTEAILSKWMPQKLKDTPLTKKDSGHPSSALSIAQRMLDLETRVSRPSPSRNRIQGFHVGGHQVSPRI